MVREIAYQTDSEGGRSKGLKKEKKAIWPTFPLQCGEFALHDLGHAFKAVEIMQSLKLPKFLGRQYDPNCTAKDFTTMLWVKLFSYEEDVSDGIFIQNVKFTEVKHMSSLRFDLEELVVFHEYRERRLLKVPLDQLLIEPTRDPSPSISLEGSSRENSKDDSEAESKEKSTRESEKPEQ